MLRGEQRPGIRVGGRAGEHLPEVLAGHPAGQAEDEGQDEDRRVLVSFDGCCQDSAEWRDCEPDRGGTMLQVVVPRGRALVGETGSRDPFWCAGPSWPEAGSGDRQ